MSTLENNFPTYDLLVSREFKENFLNQKGMVFWSYGQSGSGKTTLAIDVERRLFQEGKYVVVLDGDNLRSGLNSDLGFETEDRMENVRRAAEVAKLFVKNGIIVIVSLVCPKNSMRDLAKDILGEDIRTIYIKADIESLIERDTKGFYKKAQEGKMENLTGINATYEEPNQVDLVLETDKNAKEACVDAYLNFINSQLNG